ncbi:FAD-dependent oxidoreductase [Gallionella capsiferriformans]|uniref:FAD-dependent pyridine nucleotide-disulphide oxidoreductase n=1 Tax=Gallionella capsiferriformans (strain ES-2) TaxID=395494 RepID=D9SJL4_GALCS|nr:FAD-dependent oxidoreductase [Gallionella capsiferriformans]ADL54363.1 FAD-dependent pyridine nucleotide-disulphide oxidoreductase [Gallionella capsiferriformans ES-2]
MKVVIIGGVAGGATAAARIRRNDERAEIVMIERGPYISFANCGLPYHISGTIEQREQLLVTSEPAFEARYRVDVRSRTEAIAIDRQAKLVRLRDLNTGDEYDESYDKLLLSPGAEPVRPKLPGIDSPRVFGLRNIPDLDRIMGHLEQHSPRRAVVIGGGFIGIEVAENLHEKGIFTTLVEGADQILLPLDYEMAAIVHSHMKDKNVELYLSDKVERFEDKDDHTVVYLGSGRRLQADMVVLAIGVRPETTLARASGLELGSTGGIKVDSHLQTSDPDIYAVGDAIEVTQFISGRQALIPLAGPANRQGRMAADNIVFGNKQQYRGTQSTSILKAFDLAAATTGLNEKQLIAAEIPFLSCITHSGSHASYYPGAKQISLKLLFSPEGRILGAQAVGADGADKRIDVISTAIHGNLNVEDLAELELAYAPPFSSAKDPVNIAGYVAINLLNKSHEMIAWRELHARLLAKSSELQLIDVRTAEEYEFGSIATARNFDVNQIREHLDELDRNAPVVVFCQIGLRGYLAYRILKQHGFTQVSNLSGGYKTYSWAVDKQSNPDIFDYEDIKRRAPEVIEAERSGSAVLVAPGGELHTLNAVGLQCPGPIMKTYKAMEALDAGELLEVTVSDPAFGRDIRAWAKKTGNDVLSLKSDKGLIVVLLRKNKAVPVVALPAATRDKLTLVVFSDDLDKVMASMIIANGALAMGKPVSLFFTFWGLDVLRRENAPARDKPMMDRMFSSMLPSGVDHLNSISKMDMHGLGAKMIRKVMHDKGVETPGHLLQSLVDGGAQMIACQMSMDVMGIHQSELIDGVEIGGVAAFLGEASESGTTLFI